jgi:hypothetical protein
MIAIVAVRSNVILGRPIFFSPQIEPSIVIFWENMTDCSIRYPFSTEFKLCLKETFTKGKTGRAISYGDSRLSTIGADSGW